MAVAVRKIDKQLGKLLVDDRFINQKELEEALVESSAQGKNLGAYLVEKDVITPEQLALALSRQHGIPYFSLRDYEIDKEIINTITEEQARRFQIIPVDKNGKTLIVAISDPNDILRLDDIKVHTKMDINPLLSLQSDIEEAIERYYGDSNDALGEVYKDIDTDSMEVVEQLDLDDMGDDDQSEEAPVIKLVNAIVSEAIRTRTSDIHIEPEEKAVRLRYRIDGSLHEMPAPPKRLQNAIVSRIKIISDLDISERRRPQDGRFKIKSGDKVVDFRVSILPCVFGEKIVMRLLDKSNLMLDLKMLGFEPEQLGAFDRAIRRPFGMILVTGPTGSGKSTTLYSALSGINSPDKNIITVEDPVEYQIKGINQVQAKPEVGLSFAEGLKSILRQDPDVVMIGEIRDYETGEIAVKAALTGHLVLSTLHTNDAPSTPVRLTNMGVEPFLVTASLILVVAQRLARKICTECKEPYNPKPLVLEQLGVTPPPGTKLQFFEGRGCPNCAGTGYRGRLALYEMMEMSEGVADGIIRGLPSSDLKKIARRDGMLTLRDSGNRKLVQGFTSVKEVLSKTFENEKL